MPVKQMHRFKAIELPPLSVLCQVKSRSLGANLLHANLKFSLSVEEEKKEDFLYPRALLYLHLLSWTANTLPPPTVDCCEECRRFHQRGSSV